MERHAQISRSKGAGPAAGDYKGSLEPGTQVLHATSAGPVPLDVNDCIRRLMQSYARLQKEKIRLRTALGHNELPVMGDPVQIGAIFAVLVAYGNRLTSGGSMTILTTLLPVDLGLVPQRRADGCALLSFHAACRGGERLPDPAGPEAGGLPQALFNVRRLVERLHGCFRLCVREAEIAFNIYLPVVQRAPLSALRVGEGA